MIRILLTAALTMFAFSANAEQFRVGAGNASTDDEANAYFDTWPGNHCGIKAIRVAVLNNHNSGTVRIGRVYFAYQRPATNGPFSAYARVNTVLREGQTTAWINVPRFDTCLKKVRVYADAESRWGNDDYEQNFRVVVIGYR